jgi:hypothetical protein
VADKPTYHHADLYQGWDDPAPSRAELLAQARRERIWWAIVGAFAGFALLLAAQSLGVAAARP